MSRFRPNPVAPEIRKVLKDKRRAHNIKLAKRLQRARSRAGLPPVPEPSEPAPGVATAKPSARHSTAKPVKAEKPESSKRACHNDVLAKSLEAGEKVRREREEQAAKRRAEAEEAERQRAAAARRRIRDSREMMKRTPTGQLRLSSQMSVLLQRIQRSK